MNHLLCFGFGLSARTLVAQLDPGAWTISATSRSDEGLAAIAAGGCRPLRFDAMAEIDDSVSHVLISAPPGEKGDPVIAQFGEALQRQARNLAWVGYLSTTGVYGDHGGAWITEDTPRTPQLGRAVARRHAEDQWLALVEESGLPVHLFRLAGIYGEGRNALQSLRSGTARRIIKPGQIFSRIHAEDIAGILKASMARPDPGAAYNCADDEPCPPQDVIEYAASLLGVPPPPEEDFDTAVMSAMARSFYADCKRVANDRIKTDLGCRLRYPNYRDGLQALFQKG